MMATLLRLTIASLLVASAACADGTGAGATGTERGTYVVRTVGDSTVPYVEYATASERLTFLADTFAVDGRGNATETNVARRELAGGASTVIQTTSSRGYFVRTDTIFIVPPNCRLGVDCFSPGPTRYALLPGGLAAFLTLPPAPATAIYERIR